jgi:hypothetical protein
VALADGDAAIWTSATSYVKINAAGAVAIQAKSGQNVTATAGAGAKVLLSKGGATVPVARKNDTVDAYAGTPVQPTDMAGWIVLITTACQTINPAILAPVNFGFISAGSPVVEAE